MKGADRLYYRCISSSSLEGVRGNYGGVDPGQHFGVTFLAQPHLHIYYGVMTKKPESFMYGRLAKELYGNLVGRGLQVGSWFEKVLVEGAAYASTYGQVALAYNRLGWISGAQEYSLSVHVLPPDSIRKRVFGNAKVHGGDVWVGMNDNAADSIVMCLCAAGVLVDLEERIL